jgi:protoporphyrinogen oxidase
MRRALLAAAAAAAFLGVTIANAAEPARDERLHAFFDREFTHGLEESPEFATLLGIDGYDDRLGDLSAAAVARRRAHTLAAIPPGFPPRTAFRAR